MNDDDLRDLLERTRTIAVVGASPKPARPAHYVMEYLLQAGYDVTPVRPGGSTILGRACVDRLADVPGPVDLVDVFRAPEAVPEVVEEALALGAKAIWLQEGAYHAEAVARAQAAGVTVVWERCVLRDHRRLLG